MYIIFINERFTGGASLTTSVTFCSNPGVSHTRATASVSDRVLLVAQADGPGVIILVELDWCISVNLASMSRCDCREQ